MLVVLRVTGRIRLGALDEYYAIRNYTQYLGSKVSH